MIRAAFLFAVIGIAIWVAIWFADNPGRVEIEIMGLRIVTSAGVLALAVAVLSAAAAAVYRLWRFLRRAPRSLTAFRGVRRRQRGYQALTQGMVAVAAGDSKAAMRSARKADVLLNDPPLTMLLSAQAAQLDGDEDAARAYFEAMLAKPDMAFLGVRGLLMQAIRRDDSSEALRLAGKAYELRPNTPWVLTRLFELQVAARRWDAANETLRRAIRAGAVDGATGRRRRAVLAVESSRAAADDGDPAVALKRAREAHDLAPGLPPATVAYARRLAEGGKARKASKAIESAWAKGPHPDLAAAYGALGGADEPALDRVKRFQRLVKACPEHPESRLVLAGASLDARLWGEARRHLEAAAENSPSARLYRLMAEVEEQDTGDTDAVRRWLDDAASAPPEAAWYCADCGSLATAWQARCGGCGAFDRLEWRLPPGLAATPALIEASG